MRTVDGTRAELVVEHEHPGRLRAVDEPADVVLDLCLGEADADLPVLRVVVPDDGRETKDVASDGADAVVDLAVCRGR